MLSSWRDYFCKNFSQPPNKQFFLKEHFDFTMFHWSVQNSRLLPLLPQHYIWIAQPSTGLISHLLIASRRVCVEDLQHSFGPKSRTQDWWADCGIQSAYGLSSSSSSSKWMTCKKEKIKNWVPNSKVLFFCNSQKESEREKTKLFQILLCFLAQREFWLDWLFKWLILWKCKCHFRFSDTFFTVYV